MSMQFYSCMDFLDKLVICRLCGSDESRRDVNDRNIWIVDKNRNGNWTHKYICYTCYYLDNRFCFSCGQEHGLLCHYDIDGLWNGRRICRSCLNSLCLSSLCL